MPTPRFYWLCDGRRGVTGEDLAVNFGGGLAPGLPQLVVFLQIDPHFGRGPEVAAEMEGGVGGDGADSIELNTLIEHAGWKNACEQYCRLHTAQADVVTRDRTSGAEGMNGQYTRPGRLAGYLYQQTKNPAFARRAWAGVTGGPNRPRGGRYTLTSLKGPEALSPIEEATGVSTNSVAQGCLEIIEVLAMCGDAMPA